MNASSFFPFLAFYPLNIFKVVNSTTLRKYFMYQKILRSSILIVTAILNVIGATNMYKNSLNVYEELNLVPPITLSCYPILAIALVGISLISLMFVVQIKPKTDSKKQYSLIEISSVVPDFIVAIVSILSIYLIFELLILRTYNLANSF